MVAVDVFIGGVRVGASDHVHAELPAALHYLAEVVGALGEPAARAVIFDLGRIERHHAAGGDAERVGVDALEVIQPERDVHLGGIVFGAVELRPAHRLVEPVGLGRQGIVCSERRLDCGQSGGLKQLSSGHDNLLRLKGVAQGELQNAGIPRRLNPAEVPIVQQQDRLPEIHRIEKIEKLASELDLAEALGDRKALHE